MPVSSRAGRADVTDVPSPGPADPDGSATTGTVIAGFEVLGELGRGAGSRVFRVRSAARQGHYALKLVDITPDGAHADLTAFLREAALLASVGHPSLPAIHEVGEHEGQPYLVMDLVEGEQLAEVLARGPLPAATVVELGRQIAAQLAAVHRRGLVHRDIKPQNVMVPPDGQPRLIDFGLATRESSDQTAATVGTMIYVSPEQAGVLRRPTDNRSDLYSLGVVLFECLAGRAPFVSDDVGELLRMHAATPPPGLGELAPGTPVSLAAAVTTLLAKDPDDRYQSAEELLSDLELLADRPDLVLVPRDAGRRSARSAGALAGRNGELGLLREQWSAAAGGDGRACVVRGAPGGGKSRLALELAVQVAAEGGLALRGKCSADDPVPLGPIRAALEGYLAEVACLPPQERALAHERLRAAARGAQGLLAGLSPALDAVLRDSRSSGGQDQFTVAMAAFLAELARSAGGLLLVVDDLQWLDPGTTRVLAQLCGQLGATPVMVLGTARDDEASVQFTDASMSAWRGAVSLDLTLGPLAEEGVRELVAGLLPGVQVGPWLARLLEVRGNGNPFVVQEYVRAIVDAGLLRPSWGSWQLDEAGLDALALPQDALGLVLTRVGGLAPQALELLVTAAAIGARFSPGLVAQVHRLDLDAVLDVAVQAAQHGLVELRDGATYGFLHDRIREALLEHLDGATLAGLHLRIARTLAEGPVPDGAEQAMHVYTLAQHYLAAPEGADPVQSFTACWAAGRLALAAHSPTEAVTYLRHAVRVRAMVPDASGGQDPGQVRQDALLELALADALRQDAKFGEALERLADALRAERDPMIRASAYTMMADVHRSCWDTPAAAEAVQAGLSELGAGVPANPVMRALSTAAMFVAALAMRWTGFGFGSAAGAERERCTAIGALHVVGSYVAVLSINPGQAVTHNLRGLYWANRLGRGPQYLRNQGTFAFLCGQLGLGAVSDRIFARLRGDDDAAEPALAAELAHYQGAAKYLGFLDDGQAWGAAQTHERWLDPASVCDLVNTLVSEDQARGNSRSAQDRLDAARHRLSHRVEELAWLAIPEAVTQAQRGRPGEAVAALRRAEAVFGEHPPRGVAMMLFSASSHVMHEQNETGLAFDEAVDGFEALRVPIPAVIRAVRITYYHHAMGRLAQCRAASGEERRMRLRQARSAVRVLGRSVRGPTQTPRWRIAQADLLVLRGRPAAALALLARHCDVLLPDMPLAAYEVARVRARALAALGAVRQSRRHAQLARTIAEDHGWPHRASWVDDEFGPAKAGGARTGRTTTGRTTPAGTSATGNSASTRVRPADGAPPAASGMERLRLKALEEVGAAASRVVDPGELARITLDETIRILSAERAFLFLVDDQDALVPHLGRDNAGHDVAELAGYSASLVERVHRSREPLVVTGTEQGAALGAQSVVMHGLRSIMVAPLQLEGRLLGVVYLDSQVAKGIFNADDVGLLTALTNHIATSLETARAAQLEISVQTARRQRDLADGLREALEAMSSAGGPQQVLTRLMTWAIRVTPASRVWILTDLGGPLRLEALPDGGTAGEVVGEVGPSRMLADDPALQALIGAPDPVSGGAVPAALHGELGSAGSWVALPVATGDGVRRLLMLACDTPGVRLEDELEVAGALVAQCVTAHQKAALFEQVQALAVQDELTRIPNRRRFFEVAERNLPAAADAGRPVLAMMIDIDNFKRVNDTYGHPTGDDVIREVASRLASALRHGDLIGRYGGEEFAVLLVDADPALGLPERLRRCVAETPVQTRSGPLDITVSVGTTLEPDPGGGAAVEQLLARADQALYAAKQGGRNRVVAR